MHEKVLEAKAQIEDMFENIISVKGEGYALMLRAAIASKLVLSLIENDRRQEVARIVLAGLAVEISKLSNIYEELVTQEGQQEFERNLDILEQAMFI